jgi:hypothetical protein
LAVFSMFFGSVADLMRQADGTIVILFVLVLSPKPESRINRLYRWV